MTTNIPVHTIVGANGATGRVLLRELTARGSRVRTVTRGPLRNAPSDVEQVHADALDERGLRAAIAGSDVVYHCAMPTFARWLVDFPRITHHLIRAAAASDAKLVFADDTWMYGRVDGPMREDLPSLPVSNKGALRAFLAESLLHAHARGTVRVVIGRAPELFGPGVGSLLGANLFGAAARGRTATYLGDPTLPFSPLYIDDFARGLIVLADDDRADGAAWHIPTPPAITGRELMSIAYAAAGSRMRYRTLSSRAGRALGAVWPLAREGAEMLYQFEQPFTIDASRFTGVFGTDPTSYREAAARTIAWYREQNR
ncbi:nucleoside-diphosphate-sugar epimerase [Diaminobutyricimonas aerilata]|uniref:Nucleoside-diphosphate-sugar epimerase n=1 Tax=Diaminobutyricimonas aerilata TaxID=1162967 RepID=A0A2M9CM47_9MICO|nr:NAD-dependent epimerase/dehydratase family protein [Diaminobutyricimonas aerilata]PJJ72969.1 nucleoside-diphosphate-sugar epimerase [Diaminobutyricimonas aerilata]